MSGGPGASGAGSCCSGQRGKHSTIFNEEDLGYAHHESRGEGFLAGWFMRQSHFRSILQAQEHECSCLRQQRAHRSCTGLRRGRWRDSGHDEGMHSACGAGKASLSTALRPSCYTVIHAIMVATVSWSTLFQHRQSGNRTSCLKKRTPRPQETQRVLFLTGYFIVRPLKKEKPNRHRSGRTSGTRHRLRL